MHTHSMHSASLKTDEPTFVTAAALLAREHGADLFFSGVGYPGESMNLLGMDPVAELIITAQTTTDEIKSFCFDTPDPTLGYFSYDLGMRLQGIATNKSTNLPQGHLKKYTLLASYDATTKTCSLAARESGLAKIFLATLANAKPASQLQLPALAPPTPSLSQEQYEAGVRRTLEYIRDGHSYQLNLSIRFDQLAKNLDSLALFLELYRNHPAPFYAWFASHDKRILSTSPERFLKVEDGQVLSQPIKGTMAIQDGQDISALKNALRSSPKESAELSMIVDLVRNDISHHCEYGSVRVANHKSVFQVDNLLQMYSSVTGRLRPGSDCLDLLLDAFPGGSVTGCPKRRSMELIEKLEPHARGIYCGSFVLIKDKMNMDSSICIRTAVHDLTRESFSFYAGSGIVVDSNPAAEYRETLAKAEKILRFGSTQ